MLHAAVYNQSLNILTVLGVKCFQGFSVWTTTSIDKYIRPQKNSQKCRTSRNFFNPSVSGALRPSFMSTFNCSSICKHLLFVQYKTIAKKKFVNLIIIFRTFTKFYRNKKNLDTIFVILSIHKPTLTGYMWCEVPHKMLTLSVQLFWRLTDK